MSSPSCYAWRCWGVCGSVLVCVGSESERQKWHTKLINCRTLNMHSMRMGRGVAREGRGVQLSRGKINSDCGNGNGNGNGGWNRWQPQKHAVAQTYFNMHQINATIYMQLNIPYIPPLCYIAYTTLMYGYFLSLLCNGKFIWNAQWVRERIARANASSVGACNVCKKCAHKFS